MADCDDVMGLLINEIDELTFQELGFYDEAHQSYCQDQVSRVQEYVLSEAERKLLLSSVLAADRHSIGVSLSTSGYPRMEMVYDSSQTDRQALQKQLQLDDYLFFSGYGNNYPHSDDIDGYHCLTGDKHRSIYDFLKQESISIFAAMSLTLLVIVLF
ncbi:hypothetical protein [Halomicronema hongdechloris]|nr:hypothetical protein [Halomicronema hongdechloris]